MSERYGDVRSFLGLHTELVELVAPQGDGRVMVAPALAGRVMTSAIEGYASTSLGWVNRRAFIEPKDPKFANWGGEERLWLGPEGGQFSLYFPPGSPFDFAHWFVPHSFNDEPYAVVAQSDASVRMAKHLALGNWKGTSFRLGIERAVRVLGKDEIGATLGCRLPPGLAYVAYATENELTNAGVLPMCKETGLVSIWLLSMLQASPATAVLAPYRTDAEGGRGYIVKDDYFGKVPPERLVVGERCIVFRADARSRGKIGLGPRRVKDRVGSIDLEANLLTVVVFDFAGDEDYVNSAWELQAQPFSGDVANCYNDGPPEGASQGLGSFYELESSSPAKELAPGATLVHRQRVCHFHGKPGAIDALALALLGAGMKDAERVAGATS